jgi:hypothetical protein
VLLDDRDLGEIPREIRDREPLLRFGSGCSYAVAASDDAT